MNDFRTIATALAPHVKGDTYALLDATDAVLAVTPTLDTTRSATVKVPHDLLVCAALGNDEAMREVRAGRKIHAIKAVRTLWPLTDGVGISLKAAKEAVEDSRVMASFGEDERDPWGYDRPPF